jgi:hypothetical protein
MTQVDFQEHWLFILRDIVQPIQQKVFTGYFNDVSCLFLRNKECIFFVSYSHQKLHSIWLFVISPTVRAAYDLSIMNQYIRLTLH